MRTDQIAAVSVNHNTSAYMELMLRSLFASHSNDLLLTITVFDNDSTDETEQLFKYAEQMNVSILRSGFSTATRNNSHGEILRRFVIENKGCSHFLFLDADVCFVEPDTILIMLEELEKSSDVFGIGAKMSWDGLNEIPPTIRETNPDICDARLHPCCALVKNTSLFRKVVETVGLSCVNYLWAERDEYLDTFKLMTQVMSTHGLKHQLSSAMVQHFFAVSYDWDDEETMRHKMEMRDERLEKLRHS